MKEQKGFGLSEFLVSVFLSSLIMAILLNVYLSAKGYYQSTEQTLSRQFDLQWVVALLSESLRRSGFTPCLRVDHLTSIDRRQDTLGLSALLLKSHPLPLIQVNRMSDSFARVLSIQSPRRILVSHSVGLNKKQAIILADCVHAEVHELEGVEKSGAGYFLNLRKPLHYTYEDRAYVGAWLEEKWFLRVNPRNTLALYYQLRQAEELSPFVQGMSVQQEGHLLRVSMDLDQGQKQKWTVTIREA